MNVLVIGASLSEPHIDWHNAHAAGNVSINLSICHGVAFVLFNLYGEAHTVVLYARPTRAAIARPLDCTFFHNYLTFFHKSTANGRLDDSPSHLAFPWIMMHPAASSAILWLTLQQEPGLWRGRGSADRVNLKRDTTATRPIIIEQTDFHTFVKGLAKDCLQKLKNIGYSYWLNAKTCLAYDSSFFPDTVKLCNKLPAEIVSASSLSVFKIDIRGYLSNLITSNLWCLSFLLVGTVEAFLLLVQPGYSHAKLS